MRSERQAAPREDDGFGLAAQLAYYFFLALFPALLFLKHRKSTDSASSRAA